MTTTNDFEERNVVLERLVRAMWDLLVPKLGPERLHRLRLWEDPTFHVEYFG